MCFKHVRTDRSMEARQRLAERPMQRPSQTTRPRGNAPIHEKDLKRSLERLEALVGR
jgi:hypothetical protein